MTSSTQLPSVNECLHSTSWNLSSYGYLVIVPDCGFHMEGLGLYKTDNGGYQLRHTHCLLLLCSHGNRKVASCILFNSNGKRLPFGEDQFTNYTWHHQKQSWLTAPTVLSQEEAGTEYTRQSIEADFLDMSNLAELKKEVVNSLHPKKSAVEG